VWAENALDRHGGPLIFGARFIPGGRTATTVTAGALWMRWARFATYAAIAAIGWASYAALLGYVGGRTFEDNPLWALLVGFGLAGLTFLAVEVARRARARSSRAAEVEAIADEPASSDRQAA
jgi:membrane-associated protein